MPGSSGRCGRRQASRTYAAARETFAQLTAVGVDMDDVVQVLEDEAVDKFDTSAASLLSSLQDALAAAVSAAAVHGTA